MIAFGTIWACTHSRVIVPDTRVHNANLHVFTEYALEMQLVHTRSIVIVVLDRRVICNGFLLLKCRKQFDQLVRPDIQHVWYSWQVILGQNVRLNQGSLKNAAIKNFDNRNAILAG